ncbi:MAG: phosphoribosylformylglycinamidine cyclo-ligase [Fuerstiella sp.]
MTELNYQSAGVDLELYDQAMQKLPALMAKTRTAGVMDLPGGFAGLFRMAAVKQWKDPVLVSGTDGVGTKIKLAIMMQKYDTIGIDLVAMCVNDCLCLGATPLLFLDYISMGKDEPGLLEQLVAGVSEGCVQSEAALLGGETAIMPGTYGDGDFDMAGFCVAAADRTELISGKERIQDSDVVIGIPSSGLHSNGFSLVRKVVFEHAGLTVNDQVDALGQTVGECLLTPTRIYADLIKQVIEAVGNESIHGIAHITGGGLCENLQRIVPDEIEVVLQRDAWKPNSVFSWLQQLGNIKQDEMFRVFNMGVGMTVVVPESKVDETLKACSSAEAAAFVLGRCSKSTDSALVRFSDQS